MWRCRWSCSACRAPAIREKVAGLLELVGLTDKRDRYPVELSGGQKQRVGIARALATDPKVLLSDEATSALDPETTRSILALLGKVNDELGVTIVLITHEMAVIKEICHRVGVIEAGRIIEEGPVREVFAHPRTATARSFIGSLPGREIPASLAGRLGADPASASQVVLRLTLTGEAAGQPVVTRLARELGIDIALLGGQIDSIGGAPFALLYVGVPAAAEGQGARGAGCCRRRHGGDRTCRLSFVALILDPTLETLYMVGVAALIGTLAGLPLGIFLATSAKGELFEAVAVNRVLGVIVNATRSTPFIILVVAIIPFTRLVAGTSIGTTAAIVPLSLAAAPFIARIVEAAVREVDPGWSRPRSPWARRRCRSCARC